MCKNLCCPHFVGGHNVLVVEVGVALEEPTTVASSLSIVVHDALHGVLLRWGLVLHLHVLDDVRLLLEDHCSRKGDLS